MKRTQPSEFPRITSRRYIMVMSGLTVVACGFIAAGLLGFIHVSGIKGHKYVATVTVGPNGFLPQALEIKPGTLVTFQNLTDTAHRVDTSITEPDAAFGSIAPIAPNGGYAFTFDKKGDYKFHDGNNPTANGEVIVK